MRENREIKDKGLSPSSFNEGDSWEDEEMTARPHRVSHTYKVDLFNAKAASPFGKMKWKKSRPERGRRQFAGNGIARILCLNSPQEKEMKEKESELNTKLIDLEYRIHQLLTYLKEEKAEKARLQLTAKSLRESNVKQAEEISSLQRQNDDYEKRNEYLEAELRARQTEIEDSIEKQKTCDESLARIQKDTRKNEKCWKREKQRSEEEERQQVSQMALNEREIEELKQKVNGLSVESKALERELDYQTNAGAVAAKEAAAEIRFYAKEMKEMRAQFDSVQSEAEEKTSAGKRAEAEAEDARKTFLAEAKEKVRLEKLVKLLQDKNVAAMNGRGRSGFGGGEVKGEEEEKGEIDEYKKKVSKLKEKVKEEMNKLEKEKEALQLEIARVKKEKEDLGNKMEKLRISEEERMKESESKWRQEKRQMNAKESELEISLEKNKKIVSHLRVENEAAVNSLSELKRENEKMKEENTLLSKTVDRLETQLENFTNMDYRFSSDLAATVHHET